MGSFANFNEKHTACPKVESPRLQEIEQEFLENGGCFQNVKAGELFYIQGNPQLNKESFVFSEKGGYPYFTRTVFNNGILGNVEYLDEEHKINGNCLAIGMLGMQFFYMENDFYAGQFTKSVFPKKEKISFFNKNIALYFISLLNKYQVVYQGGLVRDFERLFNETALYLPYKDNQISLEFIENFIAELKALRVAELHAYLQVIGLSDYTLTEDEQKALNDFESLSEQDFLISDIFSIQSPKKKFNAKDVKFGGFHPYVARGEKDNGIRGYISEDEKYLNAANTISFGQDTATIYYQKEAYFTGDKIKVFALKEKNLNRYIANYLISKMNKSFAHFSWGNKFNEKVLNNIKMYLPMKNGKIDYVHIELFIKAIEKLVIKEVVDWADREIAVTESVINSH